ncbi:hypothetical protein H6S82_03190 [Planktothrix sp. FACHB-1355]|uniref:Uncharacterized protein n=1 Tax=Aerosakkonema funiforme FACHB-1375 TaxID=2949571 RepID=A0A926VCZ8_9CYAN|nr:MULTISPECIES: hypothetical protein [Oscillatoriales]MBD2181260.1 hypothetical protein [Aerosakkonema funiforme FACHB-1375]MBD3557862.1 hypothetical protein [Planktothrix sp. FACHB-1355]
MKKAKLAVKNTRQQIELKSLAALFILQALLISVEGNYRVYQGYPPLDAVLWMLTEGTSLIIKVRRAGILDEEKRKSN